MVAACARWRYVGGRRFTTPNYVTEVCLQALTSVGAGSEGGINRVEFYLSFNGGAPITMTTSTLEECEPNHSSVPSLIPGATAGRLAWFPGYKVSLNLTTLGIAHGYGTITITATVFSNAGTSTPLDMPITIFNDTDGTDRRLSSKNLWVDYAFGNDSTGDGSETLPYKTVQGALRDEMGDSVINLKAGLHYPNPGLYTNWWTSNGSRVTLRWQPGAVMTRTEHFHVIYNGTTPGTQCNWYWESPIVMDHGVIINNDTATVSADVWVDGGLKFCHHWSGVKRWSVRTFDLIQPGLPLDGPMVKFTSPRTNSRIHATCVKWIGNVNGPGSFYSVHDCAISDFLGLGIECFNDNSACNCIIEGQRLYADVAGRVQGNIANSVVTIPAAGQMRIDATAPLFYDSSGNSRPMDISTLTEIVGTGHVFRAMVQNATSAGNNGTFVVLSAGAVGNFGFPYVVLSNPSAVAGAPGASTLLWTIDNTAPIPNDFVHPDVMYIAGPTQTNTFLYGIAARDIDGAMTFFTSSTNLTRFVMWNCRDGGNFQLTSEQFGSVFTDCLFYNNTIEGFWSMNVSNAAPGTCFVNNVIGQLHTSGAGFWPSMLTVDSNHLITGTPAYGTNWTTGSWFLGDPREDPWSFQPTRANYNTGSTAVPEIVSRRWFDATAVTKGCLPDTGMWNWGSAAPSPVEATLIQLLPLTLTANGITGLIGSAENLVLPIVMSATGSTSSSVSASLTQLLPVTMTGAGLTGLIGRSSNLLLPLTLLAEGEVATPSNPIAPPSSLGGGGSGSHSAARSSLPRGMTTQRTREGFMVMPKGWKSIQPPGQKPRYFRDS